MDPVLAVAAAKNARLAWARYASTCRMSGTPEQRAWAYKLAREAEQKLWKAEGAEAANV